MVMGSPPRRLCVPSPREPTKMSSSDGLWSSTTCAPKPAAWPRISSIEPGQTVVHSRPKPSHRVEPRRAGGPASGSSNRNVSRWCSALIASSEPHEHDPAAVDQRHVVRDALDLVEQVRREEDRPALLGDRADDRRQDLPAHDRVEAGRRLVEHQQLGPERQRRQQPRPCPLPLREGLDPRSGSRSNCRRSSSAYASSQRRIKRPQVTHQLVEPQPVGQVAILAQVTEARQARPPARAPGRARRPAPCPI